MSTSWQYDIVKLLCAPQTKLCVVGDPDQTIYTWRGADVDIIMNFERDFEGCKTVILDENYRSKAHILEGANALIRNNRNRIKKDLFTRQHSDEKIVHFSAADDRNEPVWVAARIASLHHSGVPYREIAVCSTALTIFSRSGKSAAGSTCPLPHLRRHPLL